MTRRILVVEDDPVTASYIVKGLEESGFCPELARDGREGLYLATESQPDAIVLDRMLPGLDGLAMLRALRAADNTAPVLVLSALSTVDDRVKGLRDGGDDYLVKPFAFTELLARLEALLRRRSGASSSATRLVCGDLEVDLLGRKVRRGGQPIELQPREFQLLEFLARHKEQLVTRTMLLEGVWGLRFDPNTNVIDVHISRLRQKVDRGYEVHLIHTVRNAGYMLSAER